MRLRFAPVSSVGTRGMVISESGRTRANEARRLLNVQVTQAQEPYVILFAFAAPVKLLFSKIQLVKVGMWFISLY
jgi:hypothetical protein